MICCSLLRRNKIDDLKIDSTVPFGGYNWRILDIQNNMALIITEFIIEQRAYHDAYRDITWADCSLRKYLNGEFYDNSPQLINGGIGIQGNNILKGNISDGFCAGGVRPALWLKLEM